MPSLFCACLHFCNGDDNDIDVLIFKQLDHRPQNTLSLHNANIERYREAKISHIHSLVVIIASIDNGKTLLLVGEFTRSTEGEST